MSDDAKVTVTELHQIVTDNAQHEQDVRAAFERRLMYLVVRFLNVLTHGGSQSELTQLRADTLDVLGLSETDIGNIVAEDTRDTIIGREYDEKGNVTSDPTPREQDVKALALAEHQRLVDSGLA